MTTNNYLLLGTYLMKQQREQNIIRKDNCSEASDPLNGDILKQTTSIINRFPTAVVKEKLLIID